MSIAALLFPSLLCVSPLPASVVPAAEAPASEFHLLRASLQLGGALGLGIGWYQWQIELNKNDFDFGRTLSDQWRRVSTRAGYRFDDNDIYLNVGHSFMGGAYYQVARANNASMAQSAIFGLVASTIWEAAVEHREVLSLNDQIVTPVAGLPIGESFDQVGRLFGRGAPTFRNRLLMSVFSPVRALNWALGDGPRTSTELNDRGMDALTPHRVDLSLGAASVALGSADAGMTVTARLDAEVTNFPGYGRVGQGKSWMRGGESSRLVLDYARGQAAEAGGAGTFSWMSSTSLFGHEQHKVTEGDTTSLHGWQRFLGARSAFELAYAPAADTSDFLMLVHAIGPSADATWYLGEVAIRAALDGYGDFSMVRPASVGPNGDPAALMPAKSTLRRFSYYYGWGVTTIARVEATYGRVRAGVTGEWNHIGSIEGFDRYQESFVSPVGVYHEAIKDDSHLVDDRLRLRTFAEFGIPHTAIKLGVAADMRRRTGTWKSITRKNDDARLSVLLTYAL